MQVDLNATSITIGGILTIIGGVMAFMAFVKNNKKEIQVKATDYALLKSKVEQSEKTIVELKNEVKALEEEFRQESKRLDKALMDKIDTVNGKIDQIKDLIIENLNK